MMVSVSISIFCRMIIYVILTNFYHILKISFQKQWPVKVSERPRRKIFGCPWEQGGAMDFINISTMSLFK
jgi:hypothetical protein